MFSNTLKMQESKKKLLCLVTIKIKIQTIFFKSYHAKLIRKGISLMINNRLFKLSSNKKILNSIKKNYDDVLSLSRHNKLKGCDKNNLNSISIIIKKLRRIIFFNLPFCNSVKTKLGKRFLKLVCLHFPENNRFLKIFNKNTIKISYSCLPNMRNIINSNNKKILEAENKTKLTCNCRNKTNYPFNGESLLKGVYMAKVRNFFKNKMATT